MKLHLLFLFFFCSISIFAQEKLISVDYHQSDLVSVLTDTERFFSIRFSYNSRIVADKTITYKGALSLDGFIEEISSQSELNFRKLDSQNYVVSNYESNNDGFNICGILMDSSAQKLENVSISVIGTNEGSLSNEKGYFELIGVNKTDILKIESLGHLPQERSAFEFMGNECLEIILVENVLLLEEIILTEYITTGLSRSNQNGAIHINPDQLGILPGLTEPDVLQSLQLVPGISSPSETASGLHIRGGTPDQNLVLWDGIKMYHQGHFFGQISAFNPYITQDVKVYRSGTSVKYGDRIAGVIDIESTSEIPKRLRAGTGINFTQADVYVKAPLTDSFGIIASARRSYSDLIETITYQKLSSKVFQNTKISEGQNDTEESFDEISNDFIFNDFSLKAIWQPSENDYISLSSLFLSNQLNYEVETDEFNSEDRLDVINNGVSFLWDRTLTENWRFSLKGYLSNYTSNFSLNENDIADTDMFVLRKENTVKDIGTSVQTEYQFNKNHSLFSGYDLNINQVSYIIDEREDGEQEANENEDDDLKSHAIYSEYNFKNKNLLFRTGVRFNYINSNEQLYLEPRLYLEAAVSSSLKYKVSGEVKNQAISQLVEFDFNDIGVGNSIWVLADTADIPVLNNIQATTSLLFQKNNWNIDFDVYYKKTDGITSFSRGFNTIVTEEDDNYSEGSSNSYGIDLLLRKKLGDFRSWVSYSLSKTDFSFPDLQDENFPGNFDQRHQLTFSNTLKTGNFQFSLGWTFITGKPFSVPSGIETLENDDGGSSFALSYKTQNEKRLDNYHKMDASILYDLKWGPRKQYKARFGFSALNIYNRENEIDKEYSIDDPIDDEDRPGQIIERTKFGLGFTPNMVVRLYF